MGSYFSYMHRRNPESGVDRVNRLPPNVVRNTALSAAGFAAVNLALPHLLPRILPGFDKFDEDTKRQFVYYVSSCCHHLIVAPWSAYIIYREWVESASANPDTVVNYSRAFESMIPFSSGYFITDFLFTLRDAGLQPEYFLHHAIALALIFSGLDKSLSRYVPQFLVCETSTIFLDAMWFMRKYKVATPDNRLFLLAAAAFVSSFTLTRVVNMPIFIHSVFTTHREDLVRLGPAKWTLLAVQALQFWWFYKIAKQFAPLVQVAIALLRSKMLRRARSLAA